MGTGNRRTSRKGVGDIEHEGKMGAPPWAGQRRLEVPPTIGTSEETCIGLRATAGSGGVPEGLDAYAAVEAAARRLGYSTCSKRRWVVLWKMKQTRK